MVSKSTTTKVIPDLTSKLRKAKSNKHKAGDNYGNIQGELQVAKTQTDYNAEKCKIWQCKGFKYEDNKDLVQSFTPGQVVPIKFEVRAPHEGTANVSIVDTASNTIIGTPLISWDVYASSASSIPTSQTSFSVTIPNDLGSKCSTAGACVLQHFWDARSVDQTYESCIDFTVSGSGSGAAPVSSKAATSAPASSQKATSSVPAKAPITSTKVATSVAKPTTMSTVVKSSSAAPVSSSSASGTVAAYGQCGGKGFSGATGCVSGYSCKVQNDYYSQCVPGENKVSSPAASSTSCTTTITLTKSSAAANTMVNSLIAENTGTSTKSVATGLDVNSAVEALSTAVPSSALTATATGAAPSGTAKPIPEDFTLRDCLDWINYIVSNAGQS